MKSTSHGKSTADAMSAVVKNTIRLKSLYSKEPILTALRMFEVAGKELATPKLEFIYVTREDCSSMRESLKPRYKLLSTIPGTRQFHYLAVEDGKKLLTKRYASSNNQQIYDVLKQHNELVNDNMEVDVEVTAQTEPPIVGEFYALKFAKTYLVGRTTELSLERQTATFTMMRKSGKGGCSLTWPDVDKSHEIEFSNVITKVSRPYFNIKTGSYRLTHDDLTLIKKTLV